MNISRKAAKTQRSWRLCVLARGIWSPWDRKRRFTRL